MGYSLSSGIVTVSDVPSPRGLVISISPPSERRYETSAAVICPAPPRGIGQPAACPASPSTSPNAPLGGRFSGKVAWPAMPVNRARARSPRNAVFASAEAGRRQPFAAAWRTAR